MAALFTAALAHELGHITVLALNGAALRGIRLQTTGAVIEYSGCLTPSQEAFAAAAGPAAGVLYAAACFAVNTPYFHFSGLVAALSSAYNLLPVYPLDGGRLAKLALESALPADKAAPMLTALGISCSIGVAAIGAFLHSIPAAGIGVWLLYLHMTTH